MELTEIVKRKIINQGPMSFRDFMDIALYHPTAGYYNAERNAIGSGGDYYTSPVLSPLFGRLTGCQIEEMWILTGKKPFTIVEYGAGTGALCADILDYLRNNEVLYRDLRYCIIEISSAMRRRQQERLKEKVSWHSSITELAPLTGCIISNEVLDNFPVHKVVMQKELMEVFVNYNGQFEEILLPASDALKAYFLEQDVVLPANYCTEINLEALSWIKDIAKCLVEGFVLTVDYGYSSRELYNEQRRSGTLVCYKNHRVNTSLYTDIGKQDITAHVNFSALENWGRKYGLLCAGFTTQAQFLRSLGLMGLLRKLEVEAPEKNRQVIFQIQRLIMDMGQKFKVLIQRKNKTLGVPSGVQFAMPLS